MGPDPQLKVAKKKWLGTVKTSLDESTHHWFVEDQSHSKIDGVGLNRNVSGNKIYPHGFWEKSRWRG
jgi:hypothetical protein